MTHGNSQTMVRAIAKFLVALATGLFFSPVSQAQEAPSAAWRVECGGDGKTLDCRAVQQVVNREDKQTIALLSVRMAPDSKTPTLLIQLPLGISLVEPIQLKVDDGPVEKQSAQTCTNAGCFVGMALNDKLLPAMRSGKILKLTFQDANKRSIAIDLPLLGFSLALDKIK